MIKRKTYLREIFDDETMREGRTRAIKTSATMVEVHPHEYVNLAAAIEHKLIDKSDTLIQKDKEK